MVESESERAKEVLENYFGKDEEEQLTPTQRQQVEFAANLFALVIIIGSIILIAVIVFLFFQQYYIELPF